MTLKLDLRADLGHGGHVEGHLGLWEDDLGHLHSWRQIGGECDRPDREALTSAGGLQQHKAAFKDSFSMLKHTCGHAACACATCRTNMLVAAAHEAPCLHLIIATPVATKLQEVMPANH